MDYQPDLFEHAPPTLGAYTLRDYQMEARTNCKRVFAKSVGALIHSATGTGKTLMASAVASDWLHRGDDHRVLVCSYERELVKQFRDDLRQYLKIEPGLEMAEDRVRHGKVPEITVACRASLAPRKSGVCRLQKFDPERFKWLLVVDEAHRWSYSLKSCGHIFEWFDRNPENRRIGMTATPERSDRKTLRRMFPEIALSLPLYSRVGKDATTEGWVVPYRQQFVTVKSVDFAKDFSESAGDYTSESIAAVLSTREHLAATIDPTLDLAGNKKTLIYSATVNASKAVALYINAKLGWEAAIAVDGKTPEDVRRSIFTRFKRKDFQYLCVVGICREGFNDPGVEAIAILRPTKSRVLAEQIKGRACRPLRGTVDGLATAEERRAAIAASAKPHALVIDLVGASGLSGTCTTIDLIGVGLPDEVLERANREAVKRAASGKDPVDAKQIIQDVRDAIAKERQMQEQLRAKVDYAVREVAPTSTMGKSSGHGPRMPFGKHKGALVRDVPKDYLQWLVETTNKNRKPLGGWLWRAIQDALNPVKPRQRMEMPGVVAPRESSGDATEDIFSVLRD